MPAEILSYENAPRDVGELMKYGRYGLRNLAYEIGLISKDDPAGVMAFDKPKADPMDPSSGLRKRAEMVLEALEQLDKKNAADTPKEAKAARRQPVRSKSAEATREPGREPVKTVSGTNGAGTDALILNQVTELRKLVEAQSANITTLREQLRMVIRISKANMYMNGIVGEHIMQGADISTMINDGFEGGKEIELPDLDSEGNG